MVKAMRNSVEHQIKIFIFSIISILSICAFLAVLNMYFIFKNNTGILTSNQARIITNETVNFVEKNYYNIEKNQKLNIQLNNKLKNIKSSLLLIDSSGKIIYSYQNNSKAVGQYVNIKEQLHYDENFQVNNPSCLKFTFPVIVEKNQVGNAIFNISYETIMKTSNFYKILLGLTPIFLGVFFVILITIFIYLSIKREITIPLKELNKASEYISRGKLDERIKYNSDTEIGNFAEAFDRMREELKDSLEKQQALEKSRKELVACISHDLKTPITSIKAYVEGIQDGIAKDGEMMNKYLTIIKKKTESLSKLIDDLFQHSQAELGELKINKEEQYSYELLTRILEPIKMEFIQSEVKFCIRENIPDVLVNVDARRIEQVILNLIQNSKKYTSTGDNIYFSAFLEEEHLKISVKDTGFGIDPVDIPFIFQKFYRGEKSRSRDFGGAGLGLSICKNIIESHGGHIFVESTLGKGSNFYFTIPKA